tara:strand:+ start:2559 stop:3491 length:933 start_codon:yes stop_codon:yes gene_type:complete
MGLTLTNEQIDLTYPGLIKMNDNVGVTTVLKPLSDGLGVNLPFEVSTTGVNFTGTVTGISAGGLVPGTGSNSMKSANALTSSPADAAGNKSIAIGSGATAQSDSIAIGDGCVAQNGPAIAIGRNSTADGSVATAMGNSANVNGDQSIGLSGEVLSINGSRNIAIGRQVTINGGNSLAIGNYAKVTGGSSFSFTSCSIQVNDQKATNAMMMVPGQYGCTTNALAQDSIVLGPATSQLERASNPGSISIGLNTQSTADNAVALGSNVVAAKASTVSVTELETQLAGGGITMKSPNGTEYKLTVSDAGALIIT